MQRRPLSCVSVEGAQGDARLNGRDRERIGRHAPAGKGAIVEPVQSELLDRSASAIGVEADLAKEDTVGPGNWPLSHVDRMRAVKAI